MSSLNQNVIRHKIGLLNLATEVTILRQSRRHSIVSRSKRQIRVANM